MEVFLFFDGWKTKILIFDGNDFEQAFCFLENVRDPLNPKSGCYSDTQWSEKDARWPKNIQHNI